MKLSNEEKYLFHAIKKYENVLAAEKNDEQIIRYLTKELAYPRALIDRPLKKMEAIELLKYLNRTDLIETISKIQLPVFEINYKDLNEHRVFIKSKKKLITIEEYSKENKLRFSYILYDLKVKWIDSFFKIQKTELLAQIDENYLLNFIKTNVEKKKKNL